uniref:Cyclin-like domain-containing protein n=1 Tax=Arcella intermedia TaxID=1963864 RepID=A0A6B2L7I7_9EUKA
MLQQLENVYFTDEQVLNTPSREDQISFYVERRLRIYGCELIQDAGILLKLPQVTMATAQVLFHRFYFKKSLKRFPVHQVSMASLFLGAKVEEVPKRARDIINVFHHIFLTKSKKKLEPLSLSSEYFEMKRELIKTERYMLKEMGFSTYVEHPHKYILTYLDFLKQSSNTELAQKCWNYLNDSLREPLAVRFRPEVIACACIYMAAYVMGIPLPEGTNPWWEQLDAKKEQLDEIAYLINQLYKEPEAKNIPFDRKEDDPSSSDSEPNNANVNGSNRSSPLKSTNDKKWEEGVSRTFTQEMAMNTPQEEPGTSLKKASSLPPTPLNAPQATPVFTPPTAVTKRTASRTVIQQAPATRASKRRKLQARRAQSFNSQE